MLGRKKITDIIVSFLTVIAVMLTPMTVMAGTAAPINNGISPMQTNYIKKQFSNGFNIEQGYNVTAKWNKAKVNSYQVFKVYEGNVNGKTTWEGKTAVTGKVKNTSVRIKNCDSYGKVYGFILIGYLNNNENVVLGSYYMRRARRPLIKNVQAVAIEKTPNGKVYMEIKWERLSYASKYRLQFIQGNNFNNNTMTVYKKGPDNNKEVLKLPRGKKYRIRICEYSDFKVGNKSMQSRSISTYRNITTP